MTHHLQLSWALALSCVVGCATATPPAPGTPGLRDLEIEGNRSVPDKTIEARIVTSGTSWLPFTQKRYYDEAVLETDLKRILRLYQAQGFYKARIAGREVTPVGGERVDVTIRIEEGPPTLIRAVTVDGLAEVAAEASEPVLLDLPAQVGEVFKESAYESTKSLIADRLREAGYAEAAVTGEAVVDLPSDRADLTFRAQPGERFWFGAIFVAGASQVPRQRLVDEARVAITEGQLYSESALIEAQRRIFDLGVFSTVRVSRGAPDRRSHTVPVVVNVREAAFRTLSFGAGLGLDPRRTELPRLSTEWDNRNFFGGLRRFTATLEGAVVYLPNLWTFFRGEAPEVDVAVLASLQFEQPQVIGKSWSLALSLTGERGVDSGYKYLSAEGSVGLIYRYKRIFDFAPSYNLSFFRLTGETAAAVNQASQQAVLDECSRRGDICRLAYLEARFAFDRRDSIIETTSGTYSALSLQWGSHLLLGGYNYVRLLPEMRVYVPLGPTVLAARFQAGMLWPLDDQSSSVLTRFFLGGSTSQRGFGYRQLGPSLAACRYPVTDAEGKPRCALSQDVGRDPEDDDADLLPLGGNGMLGANLELRIPLPASLGLVTFLDVGEVVPGLSQLRLENLNLAVGIGFRYRTVFGPVRLDAAYRVNNPASVPIRADGLPHEADIPTISRFALHFSIGEAF
ncbi:MAG: BamA/TamA family outer membrane protein [Deltaproteobacteria bacterium]|nr:BamA/TamA family outer membrane protein [Deltaproteobacteria bacterium]